jgi:UDP-N-acetylglucosamine:LPS N-acetylglucosamine transferase
VSASICPCFEAPSPNILPGVPVERGAIIGADTVVLKDKGTMISKPKLMIVLGSGGHTNQMIRITEMLCDSYEFEYVVSDDDDKSAKKIRFQGAVHIISRPRRYYDKSVIRSVFLTIRSTLEAFGIIMNSRSVAIVSAGTSLTVPLYLWASLFRKKKIYIESWSRVNTKSTAGKICYYFADLFFVQWPELTKRYPKAIYAGRLG